MKLQIILVQVNVNLKLNIIIKSYSHYIDEIAAGVSNSFVASKTKTKISPSNGALQKQLSLYT